MFNSIAVSSIFVLDQDQAVEFYVGKLGLEIGSDYKVGPGLPRWVTVRAPGQQGHEVYLQEPGPPAMDADTAEKIRELVSKGALGFMALMTNDCEKTAQTLKARGVEFTQEPIKHGYGIDCGIRDPFGNQIRILQPAKVPAASAPEK